MSIKAIYKCPCCGQVQFCISNELCETTSTNCIQCAVEFRIFPNLKLIVETQRLKLSGNSEEPPRYCDNRPTCRDD
jgi:hypothetical protein